MCCTGGLQGSGGRVGAAPYSSKSSSKPDSTLDVLPLEGVTLSLPKLRTLRASLLDRVGELGGEFQSIRFDSVVGRTWVRVNKPETKLFLSPFRDWAIFGGGGRGGAFFFGGCCLFWNTSLLSKNAQLLLLVVVGGGGAGRVGTFISPKSKEYKDFE